MSTNSTAITDLYDRFRPDTETLLWGAIVCNLELLLLAAYALQSGGRLTSLGGVRYWLYPLVWINVGLWAVLKTRPVASNTRNRVLAIGLGVGYFLVLAFVGGLFKGPIPGVQPGLSVRFGLPPGWGPVLVYGSSLFTATLLPYKVIGYASLAYLIYATVLDTAGSAVSGVLGLLSCVSCTWPVFATIITAIFGSGTAIAGAVYTQSYGIGTAIFVVTVGLLYWRPVFGR
ncbi:MAG: hypothetical protein ABEI77_08275 [Halorientalis sp.]